MMALRKFEHYFIWVALIIVALYSLLINHSQDINATQHYAEEAVYYKQIAELERRIAAIEARHAGMDNIRYQGKSVNDIPRKDAK